MTDQVFSFEYRYRVLAALGAALFSAPVFAKTIYVDAAMTVDTGTGLSTTSAKKYISSGTALMSTAGGDTLIIKSGTYSNAKDEITYAALRSGVSGKYNIIRAETDGGVTIKVGFNLYSGSAGPTPVSYLQFEGLKWDTTGTSYDKSIVGHHIKFLRCAFQGGRTEGNVTNVDIGTNDFSPGAHHLLIEDSWLYGLGGRYNMVVYNSDSIVLRRVIARHDGGWGLVNGSGGNPEAGITLYNSSNIEIQNSIVLDSNLTYTYWEAAFYNVSNGSSTNKNQHTRTVGSIALNNTGTGFGYDDNLAMTDARLENTVVWNAKGDGVTINGAKHDVVADHVMVGNTQTGHAFANYSSAGATLAVTNSIVYKNKGDAFHGPGITHSNNDCNANGGSGCSAGEKTYNPLTNGLLYLPRIENPSQLRTDSIGVGVVGNQLTQRIGTSGSLFGDSGYNTVTSENLWPWPYEARIKSDMCNVSGVAARGFCNAASLSDYVWGTLGNTMPALPMPAPTKLRAIKTP